ncbi:MAG: prolipoprotein diacylglyceryl transferase [bacterium]
MRTRLTEILQSYFGFELFLPDYLIMLSLSFTIGIYWTVRAAEKQGVRRDQSLNAIFWSLVGAMAGARLLFVLQNVQYFLANPLEMFEFWRGGLVAYGGIIGGLLGGSLYIKYSGMPLGKFSDSAAPSIAVGLFLTRIGCFLNGCDFGKVSDLPWAVQFPADSPAYTAHLKARLIDTTSHLSLAVHPTQLYSSLDGLFLLGSILILKPYKRFDGQLFLSFILLYAVTRFIIEFFRGDEPREFIAILSLSQWISIVIGVVTVTILTKLYRFHRYGESSK